MSVLLLDSISKVAKVSCPKNKGLYGFQGILSADQASFAVMHAVRLMQWETLAVRSVAIH